MMRRQRRGTINKRYRIIVYIVVAILSAAGVHVNRYFNDVMGNVSIADYDIPQYSGQAYVEVNGNKPFFEKDEMTTEVFEEYSDLDSLGRCGVAYANISQELMPTEERGNIGMIKPSGWQSVKYPNVIKDLYLYNRCHLIAFSLAGENANKKNLITGTRYMNVEGMLPFEEGSRFVC